MFTRTPPEIIVLDDDQSDDETSKEASVVLIDLDESNISTQTKRWGKKIPSRKNVIHSEDVFVDRIKKLDSPSKSPTLSSPSDEGDVLKLSSQNEHSGGEQSCSNRTTLNLHVSTRHLRKELNKYGRKRKKVTEKEGDLDIEVVEVLDDEVVVLDDSYTSCCIINDSRSSEPDATVINRPPARDPETTHQVTGRSESVCETLSTNRDDKVDNSSNTSSPRLPSSDTNKSVLSLNTNYANLNSKSSEPAKKKSKLSYKSPAHLITSLLQPSSVPSAKVDNVSNIYNPNDTSSEKPSGLRPIVIDGNNVAISHGRGTFSLKGIKICINFFEKRGHRQIKVFIPQHRKNRDTHDELEKMEKSGTVVITPSRRVDGKRITSYDDRFIVQYAAEFGGVIVSTDNYRDLLIENPSWRETIEKRLLMFTWVDDLLMFPQDPLGRNGPSLDEFLKFPNT